MTNPTFKDLRGRTQTIEIGATYNKAYGGTITVEEFDARDCGPDDDRTGEIIVIGDGEWAYADELTRRIK